MNTQISISDTECSMYIFSALEQPYAIELNKIREVLLIDDLRSITPIFQAHQAVRGYMNIRGEVVQVLDSGLLLRRGEADAPKEKRSKVCEDKLVVFKEDIGPSFGLYMESKSEIVHVSKSSIETWEGSSTHLGRFKLTSVFSHPNGGAKISVVCPKSLLEVVSKF
jgi:chemotaxis signal transduction protein